MNHVWQEDDLVEVERYELREAPTYHFSANRREFVQTLGAGLMIAVATRPSPAQPPGGRGGRGERRQERLSDRFHISTEGMVTVLTSKVEVGQDSRTQITQAAAEELNLPVEQIRVIMADTGQCPDDGGTAGSRTTPATVPRIRTDAARARRMLLELAAEKWGVRVEEIRWSDGLFRHSGGEPMTLADLAKSSGLAEKLQAPRGNDVELKSVDQWQVLGTSVPKVMGQEVVTGRAEYPSDIRREGMVYGVVVRPPSYGARLRTVDQSVLDSEPDVVVVRDGEFLGCVAPTSWQARQAAGRLAEAAEWDVTPTSVDHENLFEHLTREAGRSGGGGRGRGRDNVWGEGVSSLAKAAKSYSADYRIAYIQHAPLEPRAAVAEWNEGTITVWTGTQQPARVQGELAAAFRVRPDRVRVIVPDTGGGFGGKHTGEVAVEAARLAQAAGRPVSLRWTREEEFIWAYFRPAGVIEVRAGLDEAGNLESWDFTNYNSGGSAINTPYDIPHGRTRFLSTDSPLRQGSYRALASTANTFAREVSMDELARLAGIDPLEFRLRHLPSGRLKEVLLAAIERFAWARRASELAENHGLGMACGTEKGSYTAACVELEMVDGAPRIVHVCQAYECGAIQNPDNLRAQVEGCLVMGLGGALWEAMEFREGRILNPNFSSYRVPRFRDLPSIDILLVNRPDLPSVGGSETPIIAIAPALANAIGHATGVYPHSMPM
jgi:CO/xanthine dehydrogenase Mo-binding subunit